MNGAMDSYASFDELKSKEVEGHDYRIHHRIGRTGVAIVAPHGGKIERGTLQVANAIAGDEHSYYCFEGIKAIQKNNRVLHITSNNFDEPRAVSLVSTAESVVTIHGARGIHCAVYAGGLDMGLRTAVLDSLNELGFAAEDDPSPSRQGKGPKNICNRGASGQGLQLELTFGLRKSMFSPVAGGQRWKITEMFVWFVAGVRRVLVGTTA